MYLFPIINHQKIVQILVFLKPVFSPKKAIMSSFEEILPLAINYY
jgi:hypothetical protein